MGAGRTPNPGTTEIGHQLQAEAGMSFCVHYKSPLYPSRNSVAPIILNPIFSHQFVAHASVQQLLAAIWYEGLPGFRRKSMAGQLMQVAQLGSMFPIYSSIYMISPNSEMGKFMKKPFVKFICHSTSYAFFLSTSYPIAK